MRVVRRRHLRRYPLGAVLVIAFCGLATTPVSARTMTFRYGPIDLAGYETNRGSQPVASPEVDGFLTGMHAIVVDAQGREIPQERVMLHHALFMNRGRFRGDRRSDDCAPRVHEKFYGTGEENQALVLPAGYGYRLRAGDRWRMAWMLMNHTAAAARVYVRYVVTLADDPHTMPVVPYWITLACQNAKIYNVSGAGPAGSVHRRSRQWRVPRAGRIVSGMAHAHGGVLDVELSEPGCDGRRLLSSDAVYGGPEDPIYALTPMMHEPAPRSLSVATSTRGWPVAQGDLLQVTAAYDAQRPHMAVMGIMHLYLAPGTGRTERCPPLPPDVAVHRLAFPGSPGRALPPPVTVQLSARGTDGVARPLVALPGRERISAGDALVDVDDAAYQPRRLSVPLGAKVRWRFDDDIAHDVTLASGPRGFASRAFKAGGTYVRRFTVPGEYRILCSLHPADMAQIVRVRA